MVEITGSEHRGEVLKAGGVNKVQEENQFIGCPTDEFQSEVNITKVIVIGDIIVDKERGELEFGQCGVRLDPFPSFLTVLFFTLVLFPLFLVLIHLPFNTVSIVLLQFMFG